MGRQEEQLCAFRSDVAPRYLSFVAAEILDDGSVAEQEGWHPHLFDIGQDASPLIGPSITPGALMRPHFRALSLECS
ncbi:hypothetical protein XH81_03955 [Bradyrhizobium sp. CCBAU 25360]|nr:hypothetical protein [Bradyrhizobium sp. CCBAU 25360]